MKKFNKKIVKIGLITLLLLFTNGFNVLITQAAGPLPVNLSSAANFSVLAKSGISTTGATNIIGNIGASPIAATALTGFGLVKDASNKFSTSALLNGRAYAADYAAPTPSFMTAAVSAMEAAYTDTAGRITPAATEVDAGNLSSSTPQFIPGIYKWSSDVTVTDSITLSGGASDVWIFQIAGNLIMASGGSISTGSKIILSGGAKASNIFWQVAGSAGTTLNSYSTFNGNILSMNNIDMKAGAILNGRALSQKSVTLIGNQISSSPAFLHVIKVVDNGSAGTAAASNFLIHVKNYGTSSIDVMGSPLTGTSTPGNAISLSAGEYILSEDVNSSYTSAFSGDCDASGKVTISEGDKTCTVTNTYVPVVSTGGGGGGSSYVPFGITNSQIAAKCDNDRVSASLSWLSNYAADSRVIYDTVSHNLTLTSAPNYGYAYSTTIYANQVTGHNQIINNLNLNTIYYFRAVSNYNGTEILGEEKTYTENLTCTATNPIKTDTPTTSETVKPTSTPVVIAPVNPGATTTTVIIVPVKNKIIATPSLPNAGVEPENSNLLNVIESLSILMFISVLIVLIPKKAI